MRALIYSVLGNHQKKLFCNFIKICLVLVRFRCFRVSFFGATPYQFDRATPEPGTVVQNGVFWYFVRCDVGPIQWGALGHCCGHRFGWVGLDFALFLKDLLAIR